MGDATCNRRLLRQLHKFRFLEFANGHVRTTDDRKLIVGRWNNAMKEPPCFYLPNNTPRLSGIVELLYRPVHRTDNQLSIDFGCRSSESSKRNTGDWCDRSPRIGSWIKAVDVGRGFT